MEKVNVHDAKTQLSKRRRLGLLDGKFRIPRDFDAALPEAVIASFYRRGK